jgi:D-alanyl-D-alanine endopeptidase (penicillin-binding protein 7)
MNRKAVTLGMTSTSFVDSSGLDGRNMSTAEDLARMVRAAYRYPAIRDITTTAHYTLQVPEVGPTEFRNTNVLVRQQSPEIGLSKTGYLREAGRCLVMQAEVAERPLLIVLLNGWGKYTPMGDFQRIRRWLQSGAQLSDTAPAEARPAEGAGPRV